MIGHVEFAIFIFAESGDVEAAADYLAEDPISAAVQICRIDLAGAIVAEDVSTVNFRCLRAAISVSTGDRAPAARMIVFHDGKGERSIVATGGRIVAVASFHQAPSIILAAFAGARLEVDFFPIVLADIAYEEI